MEDPHESDPLLQSHDMSRANDFPTASLLSTHSHSQDTDSVDNTSEDAEVLYTQYCRRWYILAVVCVINASNAMLWITFAPIADKAAIFYDISAEQVNWFALVYPIVTIPVGLVASWFLDTWGLRTGIIFASWLNLIGSGLRLVSVFAFPSHAYMVALTGQIIAGAAQPFVLFSPTKVAALWFKENQRATANTIASMANPCGVLLGSILSPVIVQTHTDIPLLAIYYGIPALIAALLSTFGVCSSVPPSPPSASAAEVSESYWDGLQRLRSCGQFWILTFCLGNGIGIFTSLSALFQQILCARGYSDTYAGICGAILIAAGVVGAAISGIIVDRNKKFEEASKICYAWSAISCILFAVFSIYSNFQVFILLAVGALGFFGFALYPVGLELGVECTYPVPEATSTGFILISGQIQTIILTMMMEYISKPLSAGSSAMVQQTCTISDAGIEPHSYTTSLLVVSGILAVIVIVFLIFFKSPYKRLQTERQLVAERILNAASHRHLYVYT